MKNLAEKVRGADLEFISLLALSSLTVLSSCKDFAFLEHVQAEYLKELSLDLIKDQQLPEVLSGLTRLESFKLDSYTLTRSFNMSTLTLLTSLTTPSKFTVKGLESLSSLLELTTATPIDVQTLANATRLTKLVADQVHSEAVLPASLQELVANREPVVLHSLTKLTRLELRSVKSFSWVPLLTKLKTLELMTFMTKTDLAMLSALQNLTQLSVGYQEDLPSDGRPLMLLTKLQILSLSGTSEKALEFITSKLPRLLL